MLYMLYINFIKIIYVIYKLYFIYIIHQHRVNLFLNKLINLIFFHFPNQMYKTNLLFL